MARSARVTADRIGALLMQGNALASQAQYRDAIRCYEKILELAPTNLDAINNRGNCLSLLGEFAEAIAVFGDPVRYTRAVEGQYGSMWQRCARNNAGRPNPVAAMQFPDAPRASARGRIFKSVSGWLPPRRGAVISAYPFFIGRA